MRPLLERTRDEINKSNIHWSKKVVAINIYHNFKLHGNPRWTFADTGRDLELSKAYVSEAVKLAEILVEKPELISYSRKRALMIVRANA